MASVCAKEVIRIRRTAGWRNQAPGFSEYFWKVVGESEGITGSCGYALACFRHGFRRMREVHFRIVPCVALSSQANKQRLLYLLKTWKPVKRRTTCCCCVLVICRVQTVHVHGSSMVRAGGLIICMSFATTIIPSVTHRRHTQYTPASNTS